MNNKYSHADKSEVENMNGIELKLANESTQAFYLACKRGIYKELNRKKLITDVQLNQLLGQLE